MNRLRIRIGDRVKEDTLKGQDGRNMATIAAVFMSRLSTDFNVHGYTLDYLGELAWDVFMEDRKIGHVKAWEEKTPESKRPEETLWEWFLLIAASFLALC